MPSNDLSGLMEAQVIFKPTLDKKKTQSISFRGKKKQISYKKLGSGKENRVFQFGESNNGNVGDDMVVGMEVFCSAEETTRY